MSSTNFIDLVANVVELGFHGEPYLSSGDLTKSIGVKATPLAHFTRYIVHYMVQNLVAELYQVSGINENGGPGPAKIASLQGWSVSSLLRKI